MASRANRTVEIPEWLHVYLRARSAEEGITVTNLVQRAIFEMALGDAAFIRAMTAQEEARNAGI